MDNNIENNNVENINKKNNKKLIIIFSIICVLVAVISGYVTYSILEEKYNNDESVDVGTNNSESINGSKIDVDFTYITELHDSLVIDNVYGFYYAKKISITDNNESDLIGYGLSKYIEDNNIKLGSGEKYFEDNVVEEFDGVVLAKISKTDFNNYMHEKFNTDVNYDLPLSYGIGGHYGFEFFDRYDGYGNGFTSTENNWEVYYFGMGGSEQYLKNKIINYEAYENYIYIYDKMVYCSAYTAYSGCQSLINGLHFDVIDCSQFDEDGNTISSCPLDEEYPSLEELSEYAFNNLNDKLNTFKHTFKKGTDGKYYWYSSEMVK